MQLQDQHLQIDALPQAQEKGHLASRDPMEILLEEVPVNRMIL